MEDILQKRAHELEEAIRLSGEFIHLKEVYEAIQKDDIARKTFEKFRDMEVFLQQKQILGQEITEEEFEEVQKMAANLEQHEVIRKLLNAEERMRELLAEVTGIIMKPIEELYRPIK